MSSPSLVPDHDETLYFVHCDFGPEIGRAYIETDPDEADRETVIRAIASGEYNKVTRVLAVNVSAGTVRNVTSEIMAEVKARGTTVP